VCASTSFVKTWVVQDRRCFSFDMWQTWGGYIYIYILVNVENNNIGGQKCGV